MGLHRWLSDKESVGHAGDSDSVPGWGRSPGEGNGNPLQYSCVENPMDRGAWWAISPRDCGVRHDLVAEEQQQQGKCILHLIMMKGSEL